MAFFLFGCLKTHISHSDRMDTESIYDEMTARNRKTIDQSGFKPDPLLKNIKDKRRCLAMYCMGHVTNITHSMIKILKDIETVAGDHGIIYHPLGGTCGKDGPNKTRGVFHTTILQIVGFDNDKFLEEKRHDMEEVVHKMALEKWFINDIFGLKGEFGRLVAVPSGIALVGRASHDVNTWRTSARNGLGVLLKEPYLNNIFHSTVFRFHTSPPPEVTEKLLKICDRIISCPLLDVDFSVLKIGKASWRMHRDELDDTILTLPVRKRVFIAHRGNTHGPDSSTENLPSNIDELYRHGQADGAEIDVWVMDNGDMMLGHDYPQHAISEGWLTEKKSFLWCHAKNIAALNILSVMEMRVFSHDKDCAVLTSDGYIWTYPDKENELTHMSIAVMPERTHWAEDDLKLCAGICSDYISFMQHWSIR
jgi:hypothetical protein